MSSLHELLVQEGFEKKNTHSSRRPAKSRDRTLTDESIALPIYICHDPKSFEFSRRRPERTANGSSSSVSSSKRRATSKSRRTSTSKSLESIKLGWRDDDAAAIDNVAIRAVISILSGYVGRFIKEDKFREIIREKCYSCLEAGISTGTRRDPDQSYNSEIIENMELGIVMIERFVQEKNDQASTRNELLQNSIRLLSIVASLNSSELRFTCGVSNSCLSACAQLYLSIVYKLEKNERASARHLLQVFCDSPFMARTLLLPDLWERFFLPHLLHLKVWYNSEIENILSDLSETTDEKEERLRALSRAYDERMDIGTRQFALYYKEWLKADVVKPAPPIPSVPLPSMPRTISGIRPSSSSPLISRSPNTGKDIYQVIFGPTHEPQQVRSVDIANAGRNEASLATWDCEEEKIDIDEDYSQFGISLHSGKGSDRRMSSSQMYRSPKVDVWTETKKSDYLSFFLCRTEPENEFIQRCQVPKNDTFIKKQIHEVHLPPSNFSTAIATISSSDNLNDCEISIRVVAKCWLDSNGDSSIEASLSKPPVIEGILEVMFTSKDDEILELAVTILAELVNRNQVNRQIILNSDPQLEIFLKLLRSSSLFLKSSVLLYLLKPKAKQMLSTEWVALVLRVLEFGEQLQTLFTIKCSPQVAAFYLLNQLLTGFDEDRNVENARKVVSLGGLSLLVRRLDIGNQHERIDAALFIFSCIKADGRCRYYLANHVKKHTILELLAIENQSRVDSNGCALFLLIELLCLDRRSLIIKFLIGLKNNEGCLNTMHLFFVYLRRAPPEHRPLVAAILFQLDLLEDHWHYSVYREEVVDTIVESLDCKTYNEKVQEQSGKALLLFGGHFLYSGEASTENWLLKQAGFRENIGGSFDEKEIIVDDIATLREEEGHAAEEWLRKVAMALLTSGNKRLFNALLGSLVNGIPCLAKASLVTITWLMRFIKETSLGSMACSILMPQLLETLNYDRQIEERVLASLSILNLIKINRECLSKRMLLDADIVGRLRQLSLVTWTAEELLSIVTCGSNHRRAKLEIIAS